VAVPSILPHRLRSSERLKAHLYQSLQCLKLQQDRKRYGKQPTLYFFFFAALFLVGAFVLVSFFTTAFVAFLGLLLVLLVDD
jgi:hypothetical protein